MCKKKELLPKLRFPEFVDEEEWDTKKLGEISEIVRGGSPRPIQNFLTTNESGINWLKIADVSSNSKYITETKEKIIKEGLSSTREVNSGDLILSNSMSFGRPYILKIKTCIHDGWIAIRNISNKTFEDYLYYFILSEASQKYFHTNAAGAAVKNLNADIIKLLPIYLSKDKREQQKIASCLSSLDEMIAAQGQKLDLLKDHKKGLMQKLFPQEGEKVPKFRFKEFENNGEWIERKLGEIAHISKLAGYEFTKHIVYENKGKIIALRGLNIKNNGLELSDVKYIDNSELNKLNRSKLFIDDLMFTYIGTIGEVALIPENDKYYLAPNVSRIRPNKKEIYAKFLLQYFNVPNFKGKEISKYISSSSQPALTMENVRKFSILLPNLNEQEKIASCLSSLDALITEQIEKIEQLKLHKKGLMQGLFPKIND